MTDLAIQIEYLIGMTKRSPRRELDGEIRKLTRRAAVEFGRRKRWRLSEDRFKLEDLADRTPSSDPSLHQGILDHPYFYRDRQGKPVALVVHLYTWPDIGPEIEAACEALGLHYEAPVNIKSWWYPGWTQLVVYTRPRVRPGRKRRSRGQLALDFGGAQWVI